jgi:hypothetical protein
MYTTALFAPDVDHPFSNSSGFAAFSRSFAAAGSGNARSRITLDSGIRRVFVNGTHNDDRVSVSKPDSQTLRVSFTGVQTGDFNIADVDSIWFKGRKGDDFFANATLIPARAWGDEGDDVLYGGAGDDRIYGGAGDDQLHGRGGDDTMSGDRGNDSAWGAAGDDIVRGGPGNDRLYGESGNDLIIGDAGNDLLNGSAGADILHGWTGSDELRGGSGSDWLYAGAGADTIFGEAGNDYLDGGDHNDTLDGGAGDDELRAGSGNDVLRGGAGRDLLFGGAGFDELLGGAGVDDLRGGPGNDVLLGGINSSENDRLNGGSGADHLLFLANHVRVAMQGNDLGLRFSNHGNAWSEQEMLVINRGLQKLHDATGNSGLTRDYLTGKPLHLVKYASLPGGATAINSLASSTFQGQTTYTREIRFSDWNENSEPHNRARVVAFVHEIAHNFDNDNELMAHPRLSKADFVRFRQHSDWRSSNPKSAAYARSGDGQWWYLKSAQFFRSYSTISPYEDWATIWELFFDETASQPPAGSNLGQKLATVRNIINRFKS